MKQKNIDSLLLTSLKDGLNSKLSSNEEITGDLQDSIEIINQKESKMIIENVKKRLRDIVDKIKRSKIHTQRERKEYR